MFHRFSWFSIGAALILSSPLLPSPTSAQGWWSSLFASPPPPDPAIPRAGRPAGSGFCAIAPAETVPGAELPLMQPDRPTLVWVGELESVELWEMGGEAWLWRQAAAETPFQSVSIGAAQPIYQATAAVTLQPGRQYEWRVKEPSLAAVSVRFAVLPAEPQIAFQHHRAAASSQLEQADSFASQQLWSDFWREALAIDPAPPALHSALTATVDRLCPSTPPSPTP